MFFLGHGVLGYMYVCMYLFMSFINRYQTYMLYSRK